MIAARRILYIETASGPIAVPISIDVPVADGDAWRCAFVIAWPEGDFRFFTMGLDSAQALSIALGRIAYQLYMSPHHSAGTLFFDRPGTGYGFRLPYHIRDLAIGDDKTL